jgi:cysteinyl-tRNA synthetase
MNDDFNTPAAMSVIFDAVKKGNDCLADDSISFREKAHAANAIKNLILRFAEVLGLSLSSVRIEEGEAEEIEKLVAERERSRRKKDYAVADKVRERLMSMGVVVEDTPEGPVWRKS